MDEFFFNKYRENNNINESQLGGTITCKPKEDKLRNELKNWRPITITYAIIDHCNKHNIKELIVLVDYEKMFDSNN